MTPSTWLCTFLLQVDMPSTLSINQAEAAIAFAITEYLASQGLPGNCSVQLTGTQGNASVANPTTSVALASGGPSMAPTVATTQGSL